ncbi:MAG: recombinase family protein [Defluviitaleaceae bacterium]|nr:recombinase family protein [Defluviitaleaceae bacterium]
MRIAIYSRKSKQTEQGDSIASQISMCKDYAVTHFGDCTFFIYEDEGFSGGNTDRPMFKRLIKDIGKKNFDVLICYRLDRISRNVANFAETLEILDRHNVGFVSIKEQFNTTTPMGKAMMYISSVFAQLERDTIAERITDNMSSLVKAGHFVSGKTPPGYKMVKRAKPDGKKYNVLAQDENEIGKIKMFFEKYLEWQSINKLETYCLNNGLKTRQGYNYKCVSIRRILVNPAYAAADKNTYEHFKNLGAEVYDPPEKWDGTKGIATYRLTNKPASQWLIGVGEHEPIISGANWIRVQSIVEERRKHTRRRPIGKWGILSGVLRCKKCGDYMRPFSRSKHTEHFYYVCSTKETSRKFLCDIKNIRGDILDKDIVVKIRDLLRNDSETLKHLEDKKEQSSNKAKQSKIEMAKHKTEVTKNESSIKSLVMRLTETDNSAVNKHISSQIEELDKRNTFLRQELAHLENQCEDFETENMNNQIVSEAATKVSAQSFFDNEFTVRRNIIKTLIETIEWDGENFTVNFH